MGRILGGGIGVLCDELLQGGAPIQSHRSTQGVLRVGGWRGYRERGGAKMAYQSKSRHTRPRYHYRSLSSPHVIHASLPDRVRADRTVRTEMKISYLG
jgi:hypothetical protein